MSEIKTKTFAVFAVMAILCASCAAVAFTEPEEEPDEIAPVIIAVALLGVGVTGFMTGLIVGNVVSGDTDVQPYLRLSAANNVTDVMSVASAFTANTNANYAQLWGMIKEHWIRQAELEAYAEWQNGKTYDGNSILEGARAFENNSVMTANAVAQFNSFFDQVFKKVTDWNTKETYKDKMSVGFILDNTEKLTKSGVNADLVSVAKGTGQIYIGDIQEGYIVTADTTVSEKSAAYQPGYVYNFGTTAATLVGENGTTYTLNAGKNMLSDSFKPGIYTVTDATLGGDSISAVMGSDITLKAGIAMQTGSDITLAYMDNGRIASGTSYYEHLYFKVVPDDTPDGEDKPDAVEITNILTNYQALLDKLYWTSVNANNAANAVWDIYDRANAKNHEVTTLMSSNVYDVAVLSASMNEVLTLSAMQQLSEFYDEYGEDSLKDLKIGLYATGMDAPFVRGNILDEYGNVLYRDVIYTPFFQSDSVTMEMGVDLEVTQNCLVAVWNSGQELNAWYDSNMKSEGYQTIMIGEGYTLQNTQLATCDSDGMHNQSKLDLKVSKVNYIAPEDIDLSKDPDYTAEKNLLKAICIIAGAILAILGLVRRSPIYIIAGLGLIVFGAFFADTVWDKIAGFLK